MLYRILTVSVFIFTFIACNTRKAEVTPAAVPGEGYFSIKQFVADQWQTFKGQPFGMEKVVTLNGKKDSSVISAFDAEWGAIMKPFFESDISDTKFLDRYNYSAFKDDATYTLNLYYEAKEDKLFTRKLHIMLDDVTAKIKSIYIETDDNKTTRKLFYIPLQVISIQELENVGSTNGKELRIEYRFLR
jgi:hypothetical protein